MILILGSKGMLGKQLMKVFGKEAMGWDKSDADVTDEALFAVKLKSIGFKPRVIINCTAYNDVDGAEDNIDTAFSLNSKVPENLAKICKKQDIIFTHFSTNYVFDGKLGEYREADTPHPLSVYAKSKYEGELNIVNNCQKYFIVRTAVLFGPKGESKFSKKSFVDIMLDLANTKNEIQAVGDEISSLTYAVDLAGQVKVLLDKGYPFGIYHITNTGQASWYEFAKEIFRVSKKNINLVPVSSAKFPRKAKRPKKSVLINTKLPALRNWQHALEIFSTSN